MATVVRDRNERCSCGSGKKYKKCCMKYHDSLRAFFYTPDAMRKQRQPAQLPPRESAASSQPTFWAHPPGQPDATPPPDGGEWVEWYFVKDKGWTHERDLKPGEQVRRKGGGWETVPEPRTIEATPEHPFFVKGKGWTPLNQLKPGDEIRTEDGWATVGEIENTGRWEKVYNFRVADFHTYFVGAPEWGFSVWAHNRYDDIQHANKIRQALHRAKLPEAVHERIQMYGKHPFVGGKTGNAWADYWTPERLRQLGSKRSVKEMLAEVDAAAGVVKAKGRG